MFTMNDVRLGNVVEMSRKWFMALYGQLENVDVAVGDTISQGEPLVRSASRPATIQLKAVI